MGYWNEINKQFIFNYTHVSDDRRRTTETAPSNPRGSIEPRLKTTRLRLPEQYSESQTREILLQRDTNSLVFPLLSMRKCNETKFSRMIFGEALFLGWVGGALLVLAGLFGICTGCGGGDTYEDGPRSYVYRPPKSAGGSQEYVWETDIDWNSAKHKSLVPFSYIVMSFRRSWRLEAIFRFSLFYVHLLVAARTAWERSFFAFWHALGKKCVTCNLQEHCTSACFQKGNFTGTVIASSNNYITLLRCRPDPFIFAAAMFSSFCSLAQSSLLVAQKS